MNGSDPIPRRARRTPSVRAFLRGLPEATEGLTPALAVAATVAFVLLGLLIRAGPAMPSGAGREAVLVGGLVAGVIAYNIAFFLAALLLASAVWRSWGRDRPLAALLLLILSMVLVAPVLAPLTGFAAVHLMAVGVLVLFLSLREWEPGRWSWRAFLLALGTMYLSVAAFSVVSLAGTGGSAALLTITEAAALAAAMVSPWALGCRRAKMPLALAIGAAVLFLLASRSSLFPLITMWASSVSLHLPVPLYAAAVAGLVYTFADRIPKEGLNGRTVGLLLLVLAGLRLGSSYEVLIAAAGALCLLAVPRATAHLASEAPAAEAAST